jgi:hypothetical protein
MGGFWFATMIFKISNVDPNETGPTLEFTTNSDRIYGVTFLEISSAITFTFVGNAA